jgi:ferrous iron transport protein B
MSTMLVVPLMNCLAKIPFYLLLIGLFFTKVSGLMMFMISTITLLFALSVSKVLSLTVLKNRPTAPFVLEMPVYHLPTVQNVARRMLERLWIFVKKIITVVAVVMLALYFLLNFPALETDRRIYYTRQIDGLIGTFLTEIGPGNPYGLFLATPEQASDYARFAADYRSAKRGARTDEAKLTVERAYLEQNPEFFKVANKGKVRLSEDEIDAFGRYFTAYQAAHSAYLTEYAATPPANRLSLKSAFYHSWEGADPFFFGIVRTGSITVSGSTITDTAAREANKAFQTIDRGTQKLRAEKHREQLEASLLGRLGIAVEPFTRLAGFNWRVNVGLIGAFAAKESVVATLGSIYQASGQSDDGTSLEQRISEQEKGWTPLHAVAMMLFMALYPPCVATLLMIKLQARQGGDGCCSLRSTRSSSVSWWRSSCSAGGAY